MAVACDESDDRHKDPPVAPGEALGSCGGLVGLP